MSEVTGVMVSMAKAKTGSVTRRLARWHAWVQAAFLMAWIGTLVAVGVLFGSFVCGWACPFGFLQDLAARVPTPKFKLPSWMGFSRYAVLVGLVLAVPYFYGLPSSDPQPFYEDPSQLFFCSVCPAGALEGAVPDVATQAYGRWFPSEPPPEEPPGAAANVVAEANAGDEINWPSAAKIAILAVFVITIFFTWRPWCTLFCPLRAIFSLCNRVSLVFVRFRADRCNDCDLCRDLCKYRGPGERRGGDLRCIRCLDCVRCRALSGYPKTLVCLHVV